MSCAAVQLAGGGSCLQARPAARAGRAALAAQLVAAAADRIVVGRRSSRHQPSPRVAKVATAPAHATGPLCKALAGKVGSSGAVAAGWVACENKACGRGLEMDRKGARRRLSGPVRPLGAWPVREVRGALQVGYGGREPDVESPWPAANVLESLRLEVESRRSLENGVDLA